MREMERKGSEERWNRYNGKVKGDAKEGIGRME